MGEPKGQRFALLFLADYPRELDFCQAQIPRGAGEIFFSHGVTLTFQTTMRSVLTPVALVAMGTLGVGLAGACALRHRAPAPSGVTPTAVGGRIAAEHKVQRLRGGIAHGGEPQVLKLEAATCPDKTLALTNHAYLHSADYARIFRDANDRFLQIGGFIFAASGSDAVAAGSVAFNSAQRKTLKVSSGDEIEVTALTELPQSKIHAAALELAVDFAGRASPASEALPAEAIEAHLLRALAGQVLTVGQNFVSEVRGLNLLFTVKSVLSFKDPPPPGAAADSEEIRALWSGGGVMRTGLMGRLGHACKVSVLSAKGSLLKLASGSTVGGSSAAQRGSQLFSPNFSLEDLGIGGLDEQVGDIFRRAFASRIYSPAVLRQMGIKHARGVLLYGPPGCGKTLIARKIGKLLTDVEPKIVNGPEVLSKYVGQSEENVRDLFKEARAEQEEKGDESRLHVIIFDEIDALCKQRGSNSGDAGVGDSVVNQLLSYIDGVHAMDNVLIIGMTNRRDMLDNALLRSGRLEVHVEIGLPDAEGREQIARIHTAGMLEGGHLLPEVTAQRIAQHTANYAGAEIEGVCRAAASYAFDRNIKVNRGQLSAASSSELKIEWSDFEKALEEVQPAMGVDKAALQRCWEGGFYEFGPRFQEHVRTANRFIHQITEGQSPGVRSLSVLFTGAPGTGATALAAYLASHSDMPYVKMLSASALVGLDDAQRVRKINEVFEGAYKSSHSVVLLDGLDLMLAWARIGPSFSNAVLQSLYVLIKQVMPLFSFFLIK
jgi:vesicle-fusing ATPase